MEAIQQNQQIIKEIQAQIAEETHALLRFIDSGKWCKKMGYLREKTEEISRRMKDSIKKLEIPDTNGSMLYVREQLQNLSLQMDELKKRLGRKTNTLKRDWAILRKRMAQAYEGLAASLRKCNLSVPHLRPANMSRSLLHIGTGIGALLLVQHGFSYNILAWLAGIATLIVWSLESGRRLNKRMNKALMDTLGFFAHPHEHYRINSATWYTTALFILTLTVPPLAASLAVIVLGFCDPAAALIGRRWGRITLYAGRTLEGSITFVISGLIVSLLVIALYATHLPFSAMLLIAIASAICGALVELFSKKIDDNLSIPLTVGWSSALIMLFVTN
jgi:dolichol kinase